MHIIRLLTVDLDGTLLTDRKEISETTRYWITSAEQRSPGGVRHGGGSATPNVIARSWVGNAHGVGERCRIWARPGELLEPRRFIEPEGKRRLYQLAVDHGAWFWGMEFGRSSTPE